MKITGQVILQFLKMEKDSPSDSWTSMRMRSGCGFSVKPADGLFDGAAAGYNVYLFINDMQFFCQVAKGGLLIFDN